MAKLDNKTDLVVPELSVVVLCYKAGHSIKPFIGDVVSVLEKNKIHNYELILVANYHEGTGDITPKIVEKIAENEKIVYIAKPKKGMMGWDMRSGLGKARGRYIAIIDGDGQMPPEDLVKVYKKIKNEKFDLVKTFRIKREDGYKRIIISKIYNIVFSILFSGLNSKDVNSKPKIFSRAAYKKMPLKSDDWFIDAEIMIQARRNKMKIGEVPALFLENKSRKSFVKLSAILEFIKNLIKYRIEETRNK
jgi:glycosyltransferase involved in cell wall biosynthesis